MYRPRLRPRRASGSFSRYYRMFSGKTTGVGGGYRCSVYFDHVETGGGWVDGLLEKEDWRINLVLSFYQIEEDIDS